MLLPRLTGSGAVWNRSGEDVQNKRFVWVLALGVCVVAGVGCNAQSRQPRLVDATITPARLQPGDTAVITVQVERDRFGIVDQVRAVVREDRRMTFDLRDDGHLPDAEPGDGIWSLLVDVPFMAPPGEFTLELTAYDAAGQVISVRGPEGGEMPLSATCVFRVEHPDPELPQQDSPEDEVPGEND